MERFLPILEVVKNQLKKILSRNELLMVSWNIANLQLIGDDLTRLARESCPALIQVEHKILYTTLKEAGLGIKNRSSLIEQGKLKPADKEYFKGVHEALKNIYMKIETGEYYRALLDIASKREEEVYASQR